MSNDTKEEFRIGMVNLKPFAYACANQTSFSIGRTLKCPLPGSTYELLQIYAEAMDVKPVITWLEVENFGAIQKGNMTGAYAMIDNGIFDTISVTWQKTEERELFFDFSYPMYQVSLFHLVKWSSTYSASYQQDEAAVQHCG
uniref:Uncharacterized protein n=1 Tax=Plectus sambesii TaxID=2011161 RepID=A0A914VN90_9BILA